MLAHPHSHSQPTDPPIAGYARLQRLAPFSASVPAVAYLAHGDREVAHLGQVRVTVSARARARALNP